jgi:4-amino-4-deoxy-L-arabinose transferase-like glycosyltransferase
VVLVALRSNPKPKAGAYAETATVVAILALLIAPTVWASYQVFEGPRGPIPIAGPPSPKVFADGSGTLNTQDNAAEGKPLSTVQVPSKTSNPGAAPPSVGVADPALINYLLTNQGGAKYLVAGTHSTNTSPIILSTDEPVIALGGYSGVDPVFTKRRLADLVRQGAVRFFLIPNTQHMNCKPVPRELWNSPPSGQGQGLSMKDQTLYDCGAGKG